MNTRIKTIRNTLSMSQGDFGKRLGITGAGISKIENGRRNLTEQLFLMICKEFNVNEKWLRFGEGEVFKKKLSDPIELLAGEYQLDELDRRIICEYISLDEKNRRIIKEYIMKIAYGSNSPTILAEETSKSEVQICAERPGVNDYK